MTTTNKAQTAVSDLLEDVEGHIREAAQAGREIAAERDKLRAACQRAAVDFEILITRGDLQDEPRAAQTLKILRAALGKRASRRAQKR